MFTPILVTDKRTGRKVHCTVLEAELLDSGIFSFNDLWEVHKDDITARLMNRFKSNPDRSMTGETLSIIFDEIDKEQELEEKNIDKALNEISKSLKKIMDFNETKQNALKRYLEGKSE